MNWLRLKQNLIFFSWEISYTGATLINLSLSLLGCVPIKYDPCDPSPCSKGQKCIARKCLCMNTCHYYKCKWWKTRYQVSHANSSPHRTPCGVRLKFLRMLTMTCTGQVFVTKPAGPCLVCWTVSYLQKRDWRQLRVIAKRRAVNLYA